MDLDTLARYMGTEEPFHPMDHMDWMTFSGANPGTYISYDERGNRVLFVEPSGDVGILAPPDGDDEMFFNIDDCVLVNGDEHIELTGFSEEAVASNKAYHAEMEALETKQEADGL